MKFATKENASWVAVFANTRTQSSVLPLSCGRGLPTPRGRGGAFPSGRGEPLPLFPYRMNVYLTPRLSAEQSALATGTACAESIQRQAAAGRSGTRAQVQVIQPRGIRLRLNKLWRHRPSKSLSAFSDFLSPSSEHTEQEVPAQRPAGPGRQRSERSPPVEAPTRPWPDLGDLGGLTKLHSPRPHGNAVSVSPGFPVA